RAVDPLDAAKAEDRGRQRRARGAGGDDRIGAVVAHQLGRDHDGCSLLGAQGSRRVLAHADHLRRIDERYAWWVTLSVFGDLALDLLSRPDQDDLVGTTR